MTIPFDAIKFPFNKELIDTASFFNEYGEAARALAKLDTKLSSNKVSAMYSFKHLIQTESFYSTKIEGTHTTIDEVYESDIDTTTTKSSSDVQEVQRYKEALDQGIRFVTATKLITNKDIKQLHHTLLSGDIRKNSNFQAGEFRHQQNKVGEHTPPKAIDVPDLMGNLERYMNDDEFDKLDLPAIIKVALIHAQFETIHPFPDGNGRVGRVLIPLYLFKEHEIQVPCFFLSQELERNKQKYYNYLQGTRANTSVGYSKWIKFFLDSISKQCQRDIQFIDQLESLRSVVDKKLKAEINSLNTDKMIDAIFQIPIFTCKTLSKETGIKETTIRTYIQTLTELEIIFPSQQKRNKRYYFSDLLDIIRS